MGADACARYEPSIWAAVDGDGDLEDQIGLSNHVRNCPACQRRLRQAVRTHRRLTERALLPLILDVAAGTSVSSPSGGTSALPRPRPRMKPRRKGAGSASAIPFVATGIGILLLCLLAYVWQQPPSEAAPAGPQPVVPPMPERAPAQAPAPQPTFRLELGDCSPTTLVEGRVLRWGSARDTGDPPVGKRIDGRFALCLDGRSQAMGTDLPGADLSRGFVLYAVVHATSEQHQSRIAALLGPTGETAALLWTNQGPIITWAQEPSRLSPATRWNNRDRFVIAWRCEAEGLLDLLASDGSAASGRVSQATRSSLAQARTLAIAHGDGPHFQGNIFAIELVSPAPTAAEVRQRLRSLATEYQAALPASESLP